MKIPSDLLELFQLKEIRFSLKTPIKRDALLLASKHTTKYYALFTQLRSGIYSEEELQRLINTEVYLNKNQSILKRVKKSLPNNYTLDEVSKRYTSDKLSTNSWATKTHKAFLFVFSIFSKVVNVNRDVTKVTREELQQFKAVLIQLPLLKPAQQDLTLEEILKLDQKVISVSTANKYLSYIVSLFKWCENEGYIEKSVANGLYIKESKTKKDSRLPYSIDDLNQLFNQSTVYTKTLHRAISQAPERVFLPLIALYQGMRVNEIAQLYTEDIKVVDEVYCIDINRNSEDKKLKNASSIRVIPIHKELIELGFIDYYKEQKRLGRLRLWSNLGLGLEGYGTNFRKWFGTFNRKEITKDRAKTFHSFRHTFSSTFRQLALRDDIDHFAVKYLLGHSVSDDITVDVYSHGYKMDVLKEVLDKLYYEGLELTELKRAVRDF